MRWLEKRVPVWNFPILRRAGPPTEGRVVMVLEFKLISFLSLNPKYGGGRVNSLIIPLGLNLNSCWVTHSYQDDPYVKLTYVSEYRASV